MKILTLHTYQYPLFLFSILPGYPLDQQSISQGSKLRRRNKHWAVFFFLINFVRSWGQWSSGCSLESAKCPWGAVNECFALRSSWHSWSCPGASLQGQGPPSEPANTQFTGRREMKPVASLPGSRAGFQPPSGPGEASPAVQDEDVSLGQFGRSGELN